MNVATRSPPSPMEIWRELVTKQIARLQLPITDLITEDIFADPTQAIDSALRAEFAYFYVGATTDPILRWSGCSYTSKVGHNRKFDHMYLLAMEPCPHKARPLEKSLIQYAKNKWGSKCRNRSEDARGQRIGMNFMYIVVRDLSDWPQEWYNEEDIEIV